MSVPSANLSVWVGDKVVCIKITGRATFQCSVDFKALINGLWDKGHRRFVLDLTECVLMDSTFLGVLAGMGLRFGGEGGKPGGGVIELMNPNGRINDLLENLSVAHLFKIVQASGLPVDRLSALQIAAGCADRNETSRLCLEAHQTLMDINPANVPKFKEVARFLAEDLQRMDESKNP